MSGNRVLLVGYGNPGRLDDGLGTAAAAHFERLGLAGVTVETDYQLQVEVAEQARRHELVLFADAAVSGREPYEVREVRPADGLTFSTHSLAPAEVLGLARRLFGARCRGFTLAIRGYDFDDFGERLSTRASSNLAEAIALIDRVLRGDALGLLEQAVGQDDPRKSKTGTAA